MLQGRRHAHRADPINLGVDNASSAVGSALGLDRGRGRNDTFAETTTGMTPHAFDRPRNRHRSDDVTRPVSYRSRHRRHADGALLDGLDPALSADLTEKRSTAGAGRQRKRRALGDDRSQLGGRLDRSNANPCIARHDE